MNRENVEPGSNVEGVLAIEGKNYLVSPEPLALETTRGGIIIPETAKEDYSKYGVVMAVGDGAYTEDGKHHPCKYNLGENIYFDRFTARVTIGGIEYRRVREADVIAVVDADALGLTYQNAEAAE